MPSTVTHSPNFEQFQALASAPQPNHGTATAIPVYRTLLADHLTPVTAYERLPPLEWRLEEWREGKVRNMHFCWNPWSVGSGSRVIRFWELRRAR